MVVSVNPITKTPTAFEPSEETPRIFEGPYQNVAEVSDEWAKAERERLGLHILENYEKWSRHPEAIADAVAAERKRCAIIADKWVRMMRSIHETSAIGAALSIGDEIRSGE